jgi:hypothetical protein
MKNDINPFASLPASFTVTDIAYYEFEVLMSVQLLNIRAATRAEIIQAHNTVAMPDEIVTKIGTYEACPSGNKYCFSLYPVLLHQSPAKLQKRYGRIRRHPPINILN